MKRKRSKSERVIRLYQESQAHALVPYLRSVVGSIRDRWVGFRSQDRDLRRLGKAKALKGREQILQETHLQGERNLAHERFQEALRELSTIDVFLLDPLHGIALIPHRYRDELAWFVYDQFDEQGIVGWRLHRDPLEKCRPLSKLGEPILNEKS